MGGIGCLFAPGEGGHFFFPQQAPPTDAQQGRWVRDCQSGRFLAVWEDKCAFEAEAASVLPMGLKGSGMKLESFLTLAEKEKAPKEIKVPPSHPAFALM